MKTYYKNVLLLFIIMMLFLFAGCRVPIIEQLQKVKPDTQSTEKPKKETEDAVPVKEEIISNKNIIISAVGDIMVHDNEIKAAYDSKSDTYKFSSFFTDITPELKKTDLLIGNLETTLSGKEKKYSGYPMFNCPESILDALKTSGFQVLTTANNHSLDRKEYGVLKTIDHLTKAGIPHTGTAASSKEGENLLMLERKGMKVAILAYTYGTNGMEQYVDQSKLTYLVNYINEEKIKKDIENAKKSKADIIIVSLHWGIEYTRQPEKQQREMAKRIIQYGGDVIFGSHPHMIQPMERVSVQAEDGSMREGLVVYSMGNFISDQRTRYKDSGMIVNVAMEKDMNTGKLSFKNITYVPTWVYRYTKEGKMQYRVLDAGKYTFGEGTTLLNSEGMNRVKQVWKETTELIGEKTGSPLK